MTYIQTRLSNSDNTDIKHEITPIEKHGDIYVKRDDLYKIADVCGGKARSCWDLSQGAKGLVTAGARMSPQINIIAHIAKKLNIPCHLHVPSGKYTPMMTAAEEVGGKIIQHLPGYNSVIVARAREDARRTGWKEIPFGMECYETVRNTAEQVSNIVPIQHEIKRIIVPVGSAMSLSGILVGLQKNNIKIPILGVCVGASPIKRLDKYATLNWRDNTTLIESELDYYEYAPDVWLNKDIELDPIYEAKCLPYIEKEDLFWIVGIRG